MCTILTENSTKGPTINSKSAQHYSEM